MTMAPIGGFITNSNVNHRIVISAAAAAAAAAFVETIRLI